MADRFPIAAITDEFSSDFETAARSMSEIGMAGAELRVIGEKNVIDLSVDEIDAAISIARAHRLEILSIASPLLKCELPDAPPVDARYQQDSFASTHTFADQARLAERAFEIANRTGANVIRVFSYWRTVEPEACFDRIVEALSDLAHRAARHGVTIGLENEHACNIGGGAETARVLEAVDHPNLKVVWDPANALVAGESPFPEGYGRIPPGRIAHVHAKDCRVENHQPTWLELGEGNVDWTGQLEALTRDRYPGWISLETHWQGPAGNKLEASMICGRNLKKMVA